MNDDNYSLNLYYLDLFLQLCSVCVLNRVCAYLHLSEEGVSPGQLQGDNWVSVLIG